MNQKLPTKIPIRKTNALKQRSISGTKEDSLPLARKTAQPIKPKTLTRKKINSKKKKSRVTGRSGVWQETATPRPNATNSPLTR